MAKVVSAIEKELLEATGIKRKVAEPFQKYADRLITAVGELSEEDWEKLSKEAQDWNNAGAKAIKADKDISEFPADEEPEPDEEKAPARGRGRASKDEEDDKPRGRGRASKDDDDDKPAARGRGRASKDDEDDKPKGRSSSRSSKDDTDSRKIGAQLLIKQMLAKNPKLSAEELMDRLTKKGYSPTPLAVSSIRSSFRNSMKVLKDAGLLDVDL